MNAPAELVATWLRTRGRHVLFTNGSPEVLPFERYRPIPSCAMRVMGLHRPSWSLHLVVRTQATWLAYEQCWAFSLAGDEIDTFLRSAWFDGHAPRIGLLTFGGADRVIPKAPVPPAGWFIAPISLIEASAIRSFGRGADRRLMLRVDARPWRRLASLAEMGLAP